MCVCGVETLAFSLASFTVSKFCLPETMHVLLCLIVLKMTKMAEVSNVQEHTVFWNFACSQKEPSQSTLTPVRVRVSIGYCRLT